MESRQPSYFLTIDQGTSGTKALIFSHSGKLVHRYDEPHQQFYPAPGWVEHDPEEIYEHMISAMHTVMKQAGITSEDIICISLSNQRETTLIWDRDTGKPVMNAVVWQCQRAEGICRDLTANGYGDIIKKKTGLVLSPYFSAAKAKWIIDTCLPGVSLEEKGSYLFGNIDSYLIWKLTKGKTHATDYSNASRTQLFSIHSLEWDPQLLELFGLVPEMMPELRSSNAQFGVTADGLFETPIPIAGVLGDSHAAFFGQCCTQKGMAKATFGTGSSVMMNIGTTPGNMTDQVVTSIGYSIDDQIVYVLEGNINCTGATIKWLVDDLELISSSKEAGVLSASVEDTQGVYLVPAFVGLSAPYWNSDVRAVLSHVSRGTKKAHVVRAAEESIAYQIMDVVLAMAQESGIDLQELRVDGGPTRDDFLMQFLSDILGVDVVRNRIEELSATGAMYMGGLAMHIWASVDEIEALREVEKTFTSERSQQWRDGNYQGWKNAVQNLLDSRL
jgi:glycerol kinase